MMHIPVLSKTTAKFGGLKVPFINIYFKKNSCGHENNYFIYIYVYKTQPVIMIANSKIKENWIIFLALVVF